MPLGAGSFEAVVVLSNHLWFVFHSLAHHMDGLKLMACLTNHDVAGALINVFYVRQLGIFGLINLSIFFGWLN